MPELTAGFTVAPVVHADDGEVLRADIGDGRERADVHQQFLRAAFNVVARNHDDHVKNIAYLMVRVERSFKRNAWAENPPARTRRIIGNVELIDRDQSVIERLGAELLH